MIRTDSGASVDFSLGEYGPVLRMGPRWLVRIVRLGVENTGIEKIVEQMVELEAGRLSGFLAKVADGSTFLVRTHRGIIEPYGKFEAEANGGVRADGGRVHADENLYKIEAGQEFLF